MVSKGVITTVAGGGTGGTLETDSLGDGCPATSARVDAPEAVTANFREAGQNHALDQDFQRSRSQRAGKAIFSVRASDGLRYRAGARSAR